jgi:hypothetical protein
MSDRGKYEVAVRVLTQRTVIVDADGFNEAEELAMHEVQNMLDGYEAEVLWAMEVEVEDD